MEEEPAEDQEANDNRDQGEHDLENNDQEDEAGSGRSRLLHDFGCLWVHDGDEIRSSAGFCRQFEESLRTGQESP